MDKNTLEEARIRYDAGETVAGVAFLRSIDVIDEACVNLASDNEQNNAIGRVLLHFAIRVYFDTGDLASLCCLGRDLLTRLGQDCSLLPTLGLADFLLNFHFALERYEAAQGTVDPKVSQVSADLLAKGTTMHPLAPKLAARLKAHYARMQ